jgi:hypothetical protein
MNMKRAFRSSNTPAPSVRLSWTVHNSATRKPHNLSAEPAPADLGTRIQQNANLVSAPIKQG